uniref:Uncharacterized protein n=1 Tax=Ciona intestinalis TaxID=7719 RepID=F6V2C9_CIOIN
MLPSLILGLQWKPILSTPYIRLTENLVAFGKIVPEMTKVRPRKTPLICSVNGIT